MFRELFKQHISRIDQSTVLTGLGVSGVISTAYFTGRASFKAEKIIRQEEVVQQKKLTNQEKAKLVWPLYITPVSVGCTTITSIVMANRLASKKIAALAVASGISERALNEYRAKVVEKIGQGKATTIRDEVAQERVAKTEPPSKEVLVVGAGDVLCFDMLTGRYFQSTVEKIRQAENKINFEVVNHMYASLSTFYDEIGIPPTPFSDTVGWNVNDRLEVVFSTVLSPDQRPCVAIDFSAPPIADYSKLW